MEKVDYMISLEELFKRGEFQTSDLIKAANTNGGGTKSLIDFFCF